MLHALSAHLARSGLVIAVAGTALALATGQALAVGGWTIASAPPTGQNATLTGVATVSDSDAWAVGFRNGNAFTNVGAKVLIDNWNGTAWSVSPSFTAALSAYAVGVADISPTDAYAVGNNSSIPRGHLAHWDGTAWSSVTVPVPPNAPTNTTLEAISADGPNDVWAVGTFLDSANGQFENFSIHFNGSAWSVVPMPLGSGQFNAIQANSPSDVWAVGENSGTLIEHFNGTAWSVVPSPSPGSNAMLGGVTTSNAANDVWAVGADTVPGTSTQQTLTLNWNGTAWTTVASPNVGSDRVGAVATNPGAAIVWAVGGSGTSGSFNPLVLQNG